MSNNDGKRLEQNPLQIIDSSMKHLNRHGRKSYSVDKKTNFPSHA